MTSITVHTVSSALHPLHATRAASLRPADVSAVAPCVCVTSCPFFLPYPLVLVTTLFDDDVITVSLSVLLGFRSKDRPRAHAHTHTHTHTHTRLPELTSKAVETGHWALVGLTAS